VVNVTGRKKREMTLWLLANDKIATLD